MAANALTDAEIAAIVAAAEEEAAELADAADALAAKDAERWAARIAGFPKPPEGA